MGRVWASKTSLKCPSEPESVPEIAFMRCTPFCFAPLLSGTIHPVKDFKVIERERERKDGALLFFVLLWLFGFSPKINKNSQIVLTFSSANLIVI